LIFAQWNRFKPKNAKSFICKNQITAIE
jgi:hypothetical protein